MTFHTKHIDNHTLSKKMTTMLYIHRRRHTGVPSAANSTPGTWVDPSNTEIVFRLLSPPSAAQRCTPLCADFADRSKSDNFNANRVE
jgi:hypothetical protein